MDDQYSDTYTEDNYCKHVANDKDDKSFITNETSPSYECILLYS